MCEIRLLEPSDIEVRAQQVTQKGASLLLYKNARVDMAILDEKFGMFGWQREHLFKDGKNYCRVSIWDKENKQWVTKEDIGTESNTEREKGEASDAFKRACVNIGIGRELYTSPFIWVALDESEVSKNEKSGKWQIAPRVNFEVKHIAYDSKRTISELEIVDQNGTVRYSFPRRKSQPAPNHRGSADTDNPIEKAEPVKPPKKGQLTSSILDDNDKCEKWLNWAYGGYTASGYSESFDVKEYLLRMYNADSDILSRFAAMFESYKIARKNAKR